MAEYEVLTQRAAWVELGDQFVAQLADLNALAFGDFPGVVEPSPEWMRWYLARPGMDAELSAVALWRKYVVSNVFVTRLRFPVAGQMLNVGMIDTVMTHPEHRRRGLASGLLHRALEGLRRSADAAALYTLADSVPFRLYVDMGFRRHRGTLIWTAPCTGPAGHETGDVQVYEAPTEQHGELCTLVNDYNEAKDGYVRLDEPLWRWRKWERPTHIPVRVLCARARGELVGTASACPFRITTAQGPEERTLLADLAFREDAPAAALGALLMSSPPAGRWLAASGEGDRALAELLARHGFSPEPGEVSLFYPFTSLAEEALHAEGRPWYVLTESTIGV